VKLELRQLEACGANDLCHDMALLVNANSVMLEREFPGVPRLYGTPDKALETLQLRQRQITQSNGRYGAFVVQGTVAGHRRLIGMVTVAQRTKWFKLPGKTLPMRVRGPLIAGWLDQIRPQELRRVGLQLGRLLVGEITAGMELVGTPWTVARPVNHLAGRRIEAVDNGFGGFVAIGQPRDYSMLDGVEANRQLYVANYSIGELAAMYAK
jgi:hypothetical protein